MCLPAEIWPVGALWGMQGDRRQAHTRPLRNTSSSGKQPRKDIFSHDTGTRQHCRSEAYRSS